MMPKSPILTVTTATLLQRIAWLEFNGQHIEANALRDLTAWFTPPYRVDEAVVQRHIAEMVEARDKPPRLD
jgi:hypothetical protein